MSLSLSKDERVVLSLLKSSDKGLCEEELNRQSKLAGVELDPQLVFAELAKMDLVHYQERRGLHKANPKAWEVL